MLTAAVIGNLGSDAEMKYSTNGSPLLRCNVAANFRAKSTDGEWEERTEWVRVTVFGKRAETLGQYLRKGTKVYASGRLEARPWTDQAGNVKAGLELLANDVEFMSERQQDGQQARPTNTVNRQSQRRADDDDLESVPF
jgi:single-strand DNA-binding protein